MPPWSAARCPGRGTACAMVWKGRQYAVYVRGPGLSTITLDLPAGRYQVRWLDTRTGRTAAERVVDQRGSRVTLPTPSYEEDIALGIRRGGNLTVFLTLRVRLCQNRSTGGPRAEREQVRERTRSFPLRTSAHGDLVHHGRAELTGRRLAPLRSAQLRDDLREVLDVVVLHGEAGQPVFFAVAGQGVGHLAG